MPKSVFEQLPESVANGWQRVVLAIRRTAAYFLSVFERKIMNHSPFDRVSTLKTGVVVALLLAAAVFSGCTDYNARIRQIQEELAVKLAQIAREKDVRPDSQTLPELVEKNSILRSDPELADIRDKSGISFTGCPVDPSDNTYPTEVQRKAIRKFSMIFQERRNSEISEMVYFDEFPGASNLGMRKLALSALDARMNVFGALYNKKLTWRQHGELCAKIEAEYAAKDANLDRVNAQNNARAEAVRRQQEYQQEQERRRQQQEERRHRETIDAIRAPVRVIPY
jgi:hypothetical protein